MALSRVVVIASLSIGLASAVSAVEPVDTSQIHVKKAIAETMTPEQLVAYKERLARNLAERALTPGPRTQVASDSCPTATNEVSTLPFGVSDTTVGQVDDYDLPADTTNPTCTAPVTCTGAGPAGSLPRGAIYTGTGTGPDRAYRIQTSANCDLTITMDPTGAQDLALLLYAGTCSSSLADCACVDDTGVGGVAESVQLSAVAGADYFVVIDGYSTSGTPPGPSGPFTLAIPCGPSPCRGSRRGGGGAR
jgi:hypothetical protein